MLLDFQALKENFDMLSETLEKQSATIVTREKKPLFATTPTNTPQKTHISEEEIPVDPKVQKAWLRELKKHPLWQGKFENCVYIMGVFANPKNQTIEEDDNLNTDFQIWIEAGAPNCHDINLDCGASNLKEALLSLKSKVNAFYHPCGKKKELPHCLDFDQECVPDSQFCSKCGYRIEEDTELISSLREEIKKIST